MPTYRSPQGHTCTAADALQPDGRTLRPGYSEIIGDGERLHFSPNLLDAAPISGAGSVFLTDKSSIDAAFQAKLETEAKTAGLAPSEYLATLRSGQLEKLIAGVVEQFVAAAGAEGIAKALTVDSAPFRLALDMQHGMHAAKFSFAGKRAPSFDRDRARSLMDASIRQGIALGLRDASCHGRNPTSTLQKDATPTVAASNAAVRDLAIAHRYF